MNNQITDWSFKVDGILHNVSQDAVYDDVVRDVTKNCLDGYNGTILCYGQTGAGKTYVNIIYSISVRTIDKTFFGLKK